MKLKDQLTNALTAAMRAQDDVRKVPLRLVLAAIKEAEIEQKGELAEGDILRIVQKEVKARQESIADAEKAKRQDLIDRAMAEMAVLEEFLPEGLSETEIETLVKAAIAEVGATSMKDMGLVMKALMPKIQGRADGSQVSQLVRQLLGQ